MKKIFSYFEKGFTLTNKSWDIFLLSVVISSILQFSFLSNNSSFHTTFFLLITVFYFLYLGFFLSIPAFLTWKQESKPLNLITLLKTVLGNTKRIIFPIIIIFCSIFVYIIMFSTIFIMVNGDGKAITVFLHNLPKNVGHWNPYLLLLVSLLYIFVFTSIYFSIEKKNFFNSLWSSVKLSLKNPMYIGVLIIMYVVYYSILIFVLPDLKNNLQIGLRIIVYSYVHMIFVSSALYFYQKNSKYPN